MLSDLRQYNYTVISILIFIILNSCSNEGKTSLNNNFNDKLTRMENEVIGINLSLMDTVIQIEHDSCPKILFLLSGGDCGGCLNQGFKIIKDLEAKLDLSIFVIGSNINSSLIQFNYDYKKIIFRDDSEILRKRLMYSLTPVILYLDSQNVVKEIFFPLSNYDQTEKLNNFLHNITY